MREIFFEEKLGETRKNSEGCEPHGQRCGTSGTSGRAEKAGRIGTGGTGETSGTSGTSGTGRTRENYDIMINTVISMNQIPL